MLRYREQQLLAPKVSERNKNVIRNRIASIQYILAKNMVSFACNLRILFRLTLRDNVLICLAEELSKLESMQMRACLRLTAYLD